ncbi:MAG: HAD family hydrolase [Terriglobales bacterium]
MAPERVGVMVFDLDGVLVDVRASFRVAIERTVAALGGGAVRTREIQTLKNAGGYNNEWDVTRELLRQRGLAVERARVIEVFNGFYLGGAGGGGGLILQERWLLPPALLLLLRRRYRLAIFTGRPAADASFTLRHFGVEHAFETVLGLEHTAHKPDPDGLERLRRKHAPVPLLAYFGDTVDDARCAAAAGVPFHGIVDRRGRHGRELADWFQKLGCLGMAASIAQALRPLLAPRRTD